MCVVVLIGEDHDLVGRGGCVHVPPRERSLEVICISNMGILVCTGPVG